LWGIFLLLAIVIHPASSLLVIRTFISISNSPFSERLINSWKFVPFPEASTPIFNFGAFTHTSIAIRDSILSVKLPFYEVHISNVYAREEFRHKSFFNDIAVGSIVGFGFDGYEFALDKIMRGKDGS